MTDDDDRYLNLRELAQYAGLSECTLRRLARQPVDPLPAYRVGTRILVKRSEFDAWLRGTTLDARVRRGAADERLATMADAAVRAIRGGR